MGKLPKMKSRIPSQQSRALRRAISPSINTRKPPKASSPEWKTEDPDLSVLSAQHGAGITKKQKKQKPMSRQQRLRKEKAVSRADVVIDKMEKKVGVSKKKSKVIKERSAAWEDLNAGGVKLRRKVNVKATDGQDIRMVDLEEVTRETQLDANLSHMAGLSAGSATPTTHAKEDIDIDLII